MELKHIPMTTIRSMHLQRKPGSEWFSKGAMAFFNTKLPAYGYDTPTGIYFVTGERYSRDEPLKYTVRKLSDDGGIETVGDFCSYATARAASAHIKQLAIQ